MCIATVTKDTIRGKVMSTVGWKVRSMRPTIEGESYKTRHRFKSKIKLEFGGDVARTHRENDSQIGPFDMRAGKFKFL